MIPWIRPLPPAASPFPPVATALRDPNGLLAAGGDLSPERLLDAYAQGIFPWYGPGEPILWWSPDPRMVLFPREIRIRRSLRQTLRRGNYRVRLDQDFAAIIRACAETPRPGQDSTWIVPAIETAYLRLHAMGYAHCVAVYGGPEDDAPLVGGLYGMALGKAFFGESMFSRRSDASKIALAHLCRYLDEQGFGQVDCQAYTQHLESMGARQIPRAEFSARLARLRQEARPPAPWPENAACYDWSKP